MKRVQVCWMFAMHIHTIADTTPNCFQVCNGRLVVQFVYMGDSTFQHNISCYRFFCQILHCTNRQADGVHMEWKGSRTRRPANQTSTTVQAITAAGRLGDHWLFAQPGNRLPTQDLLFFHYTESAESRVIPWHKDVCFWLFFFFYVQDRALSERVLSTR